MTENDDILVRNFLQENKVEVADNGFSRRVMRRLPNRSNQLSMLLQVVSILAALFIFIVNDGGHTLKMSFISITRSMDFHVFNDVSLPMILITGAFLTVLGYYRYDAEMN